MPQINLCYNFVIAFNIIFVIIEKIMKVQLSKRSDQYKITWEPTIIFLWWLKQLFSCWIIEPINKTKKIYSVIVFLILLWNVISVFLSYIEFLEILI